MKKIWGKLGSLLNNYDENDDNNTSQISKYFMTIIRKLSNIVSKFVVERLVTSQNENTLWDVNQEITSHLLWLLHFTFFCKEKNSDFLIIKNRFCF